MFTLNKKEKIYEFKTMLSVENCIEKLIFQYNRKNFTGSMEKQNKLALIFTLIQE